MAHRRRVGPASFVASSAESGEGTEKRMSKEDIERLVTERSVVRQTFDDHQVAGFWATAIASYATPACMRL
jgi:hypothetical protein